MGIAVWRDISLLWLIFLFTVAILPLGVILAFAIRGMNRLRQVAKKYLPVAQEKVQMVADKTDELSLRIAEPVIGAYTKAAQVKGTTRAILRKEGT
jgi:hypothetical protein